MLYIFAYIFLVRFIKIHHLCLNKPKCFAFKTNINRNLFVRSLKNHDFTFFLFIGIIVPTLILLRGRESLPPPRSQAKSLHESPLQAVPILSALLACPLPLLRAQAPPATPAVFKSNY